MKNKQKLGKRGAFRATNPDYHCNSTESWVRTNNCLWNEDSMINVEWITTITALSISNCDAGTRY